MTQLEIIEEMLERFQSHTYTMKPFQYKWQCSSSPQHVLQTPLNLSSSSKKELHRNASKVLLGFIWMLDRALTSSMKACKLIDTLWIKLKFLNSAFQKLIVIYSELKWVHVSKIVSNIFHFKTDFVTFLAQR